MDPQVSSFFVSFPQAVSPVIPHAVQPHPQMPSVQLLQYQPAYLHPFPDFQSFSVLLLHFHRSDLPDGTAHAVPYARENPVITDDLFQSAEIIWCLVLPSGSTNFLLLLVLTLRYNQQTGSPIPPSKALNCITHCICQNQSLLISPLCPGCLRLLLQHKSHTHLRDHGISGLFSPVEEIQLSFSCQSSMESSML